MRITEAEFQHPKLRTVGKLVLHTVRRLLHDPLGILLGSAFVLIMLWGFQGKLGWIGLLWNGWKGPGSNPLDRARILPGIPWDQEWLSFAAGVVLLVIVPAFIIKFVLKQDLRNYGLCLPPRERRAFAWLAAAALFLVSVPAFYVGMHDSGMRATYPLYRAFATVSQFALYELGYLLFFVTIEFIFRGYLLFGLYQFRDQDALPGVGGVRGPLVFGSYSILLSMLSYTAWHLGKPAPELWGTLFWGIAAGAVALESRSIVPLVAAHWLLNVFLDFGIWQGWCGWPFCR